MTKRAERLITAMVEKGGPAEEAGFWLCVMEENARRLRRLK